jgi:NTP pyrophosphatase (non-canonical NTP hydrolase)
MNLEEYQDFISNKWRYRKDENGLRHLFVICTGLAGEVGEVLEPIKKSIRDPAYKLDLSALKLELGDVLSYLTKIADFYDMTLQEVMDANAIKLKDRFKIA